MLLDRIDIDNHGPLRRVELGPFSEFLNVVCMPEGSGKTAITRFIRDSLVRREYPLGMMSSSAGRVVWADRNGKIHCRREHDGTPSGRRTVEFETRGDAPRRYDRLQDSWIDGIADSTDASRALEAIRIPESIVDGLLTDTAVTSVSRVIAASLSCGLGDPALFAELPSGDSNVSGLSPAGDPESKSRRRAIRDELARIEAELASWNVPLTNATPPYGGSLDAVQQRRQQLWNRLDRCVSRAAELRQQPIAPSHVDSTGGGYPHSQPRQHSQHWQHAQHWQHSQHRQHAAGSDLAAIESEIASIMGELQVLDRSWTPDVTVSPRVEWLRKRRDDLLQQLGTRAGGPATGNPLADEASQWLVRLSAGRLRRVDWNPADFTTAPERVARAARAGFAVINGRKEAACSGADRALAALAVRLAAGDLLARTGRPIPIVVETQRELLRPTAEDFTAGHPSSPALNDPVGGEVNLALVAALDDYTKNGRQIVVLCSDGLLAEQVQRRGGRVFHIHGQRVRHEHRPMWKPHFGDESFVGPYARPRTRPSETNPLHRTDAIVGDYYDQYFDNLPMGDPFAEINRNLDVIWQEAYGTSPHTRASFDDHAGDAFAGPRTTSYRGDHFATPVAAGPWHDGYYFNDLYTTAPIDQGDATKRQQNGAGDRETTSRQAGASERRKASPFFLTVDSPIDQAPSVDAVAASRLRRLDVTHVTHLLNQDPNRLADALGLASVSAATIRRWQAECRLVCCVPQLRGFDARVLVGCGIADPDHLSATDPNDLLDRVEAFLATERGQRILLSGTSYELSRITSWIAAANVGTDDGTPLVVRDDRTIDGRVIGERRRERAFAPIRDEANYEYRFVDDDGQVIQAKSKRKGGGRTRALKRSNAGATRRERSATGNRKSTARNERDGDASGVVRSSMAGRRSVRRNSGFGAQHVSRTRPEEFAGEPLRPYGEPQQLDRSERDDRVGWDERSRSERAVVQPSRQHPLSQSESESEGDAELRFYLSRESAVVDAPSIGERMAERLAAVGIETVDDLIHADPAEVAEQLDRRRIDAAVITAWQNQAILVCRIPMLRGHDAQLLVAAGVTTPEAVAAFEPAELFALIDPVAKSNEGQRILRGGKLPDLGEIGEWIEYATQNRDLVAA